jgi:hypothetical protein
LEHFTEDEKKEEEHRDDDKYNVRMNVMKVFNAIVDRKPTPEEIDKFSNTRNEQDLIADIYKAFKEEKSKEKFEVASDNIPDKIEVTEPTISIADKGNDEKKTSIHESIQRITQELDLIKTLIE